MPPGDWLVWGSDTEPPVLNCARANDRSIRQICRLVADSLVDFDQDHGFVPRLAESFEVSDDGLTLTFHLRRGVTWHDGRPLTAADVLHTVDLARRLDPNGAVHRARLGPLSRVEAPDDHTVRAFYAEPHPRALAGWRDTFIVPAHVPINEDGTSPLDREPVGTGPFRFVRWDPQTQIVLEANRSYFGPRPHVNRYVHRILGKVEALRAAAAEGSVDVAPLGSEWIARRHDPRPDLPFRVLVFLTSSMDMLFWNLEEPRGLFRDSRARRALTMLIDRAGYAATVQHGAYEPVATLIDPRVWGGDPDLAPLPFDPRAASDLLDEAGLVDRDGDGVRDTTSGPMSFTLLYYDGSPGHREIGEILESTAAGVGVRVALRRLEWTVLKELAYGGRFEACLIKRSLEDLPDPYLHFHSSQIGGEGKNVGRYRSAEFDRLSEELRRTLDSRREAELLKRLQHVLHEDQPCTFIALSSAVLAVNRRFRTPPVPTAGPWDWYPSLLLWWVPPGERKYH